MRRARAWCGRLLGRLSVRSWLLGHPARFRTSGRWLATKVLTWVEVGEIEAGAVERFRAYRWLARQREPLLSGRNVVVFESWADLGLFLERNCGPCARCFPGLGGVVGVAPCNTMPRILGQYFGQGVTALGEAAVISGGDVTWLCGGASAVGARCAAFVPRFGGVTGPGERREHG